MLRLLVESGKTSVTGGSLLMILCKCVCDYEEKRKERWSTHCRGSRRDMQETLQSWWQSILTRLSLCVGCCWFERKGGWVEELHWFEGLKGGGMRVRVRVRV